MAVDSNIGSLPAAASIEDDSLLVAEQQGEAKHITGKLLKDYAKQGVDALVTAAQEAAAKALKAAQEAEEAAGKIQDVTDEAEAAIAAAKAAEAARQAAVAAQSAAEQAAALAAQNAVADVENRLQGYVDDAQTAKNAAEQAAENAAAKAVQQVESQLEDYVSDAKQAKEDAQSAAGTAAQDAVSAANAQLVDYLSAAQAAQAAAEKARDEAQAIAGGDFASTAYVDQKASTAENNANAYTDQKIAAIPTPDVSKQIGEHNVDPEAHPTIQLLISELNARLNALANSEDVDLDQMAELVAYIKDNRELIDQITTGKVSVSDIIDNLTTNVANKPLSAAQGVALKALVDALQTAVDGKQSKITGTAGQVVGFDANGNPVAQAAPQSSSVHHFFITIPTAGWTENSDTGVKSVSIAVEGVTADMNGTASPYFGGDKTSEGYAAFVEAKNQFLNCITNGDAETYDGGVIFNVYGDVPTVAIPVMVEVA